MDEREAKAFVKVFNKEFGPPFLPKGFATAKIYGEEIAIVIGRRDASFTFGWKQTGSGTHLASKWNVVDMDQKPRKRIEALVEEAKKRGSR